MLLVRNLLRFLHIIPSKINQLIRVFSSRLRDCRMFFPLDVLRDFSSACKNAMKLHFADISSKQNVCNFDGFYSI